LLRQQATAQLLLMRVDAGAAAEFAPRRRHGATIRREILLLSDAVAIANMPFAGYQRPLRRLPSRRQRRRAAGAKRRRLMRAPQSFRKGRLPGARLLATHHTRFNRG